MQQIEADAGPDRATYIGTPEQLIEAGIITRVMIPPDGKHYIRSPRGEKPKWYVHRVYRMRLRALIDFEDELRSEATPIEERIKSSTRLFEDALIAMNTFVVHLDANSRRQGYSPDEGRFKPARSATLYAIHQLEASIKVISGAVRRQQERGRY